MDDCCFGVVFLIVSHETLCFVCDIGCLIVDCSVDEPVGSTVGASVGASFGASVVAFVHQL